jgi:hypothetical protein
MFKRTLKNGFRVMHVTWASSKDTDIINVAAKQMQAWMGRMRLEK